MQSISNIQVCFEPRPERPGTARAEPKAVKVNLRIADQDLEFQVEPVSFSPIVPGNLAAYDLPIWGAHVRCKDHALLLLLCCKESVVEAGRALVNGLVSSISVSDSSWGTSLCGALDRGGPDHLTVPGIQLITAPGAWPDDKPPVRYTQFLNLPEDQEPRSAVVWSNLGRTTLASGLVIINGTSGTQSVLRMLDIQDVRLVDARVCIEMDDDDDAPSWYTIFCSDQDAARKLASDLSAGRVQSLELNSSIRAIVCRDDPDNCGQLRLMGAENLPLPLKLLITEDPAAFYSQVR